MKRSRWFALILVVLPVFAQAQNKKEDTSPPAGSSKPCLIAKHKGTVGRRLLWTALIGVPIAPGAKYDHVDALDFQKAKATYSGKELQQFQSQGVRVLILEKDYTQESLDSARRSCREEAPSARPKQDSKPAEQKQGAKPSA